MKLTFLFFLMGLMQVSASLYSQTTKLTLEMSNTRLVDVLEEIEKQSEFRFAYSSELIDMDRRVSVDIDKKNIEETLNAIFEDTSVKYSLHDRHIMLYPGEMESVVQQQSVISGIVTDESGQPIPGVTVAVKGSAQGTVTNSAGEFSISNLSDNATLVFSFVGMKTQEIPIENKTTINVTMETDAIGIEEVVAIGYGTQKKSDIVGSVASIPDDKLENSSDLNVFQALQASTPGINISRSSGNPGESGNIQIRGLNSITASNNPLIVVDGIPFSGNMRDINPNDISSIEVLKDASASAIYGSRAANGVILISTKRGEIRGTVIEFNTSWSIKGEAVEYQLMDAQQFWEFRKQGHINDGTISGNEPDSEIAPLILEVNELISWERGESIDWMDEMLNDNPLRQDYSLSVSTANEDVNNYLSLSFVEDQGLQRSTGFSRITLKNNLELLSVAPWLKIGDNLLFTYNDYNRMVFGRNNQSAFYNLSPFARIYEDDGTFTKHPQANDELAINPVAEIELSSSENNFYNFFNNLFFEINPDFLKGFKYRMNFGSTIRFTKEAIYWPRGTWLGDANNGLGEVEDSRILDFTWENILSYNKTFGNHSFNFTGLYSMQSFDFERSVSGASGFVTDDLLWYNLNSGENVLLPESGGLPKNEWDLISYMIRMNYNYKEKYYVTATARRDGYSGFAANRKYGNFPSVALAWRISSEPFMEGIAMIDHMKLRASYGTVGNQAVGTYNSLARLRNAPYVFGESVTGGVAVSSLRNDNLGWESTTSLNIGNDFVFYNGRISGSLDFYNSRTSDLLLQREIPKITGQNSILFNIGEVKNTGFEVGLNTIPVTTENFVWTFGINFSTNRNEIAELYGDDKDDVQNNWFIGEPLNVIYDFEADGIWQLGQEDEIAESATPNRKPGDVKIVDQDGDGSLTADDRIIVGVQQPDWLGGLSSTFSYKNISLYIFVQTVQGIDKRFQGGDARGGGPSAAMSARFNTAPYDYWTPENPSNSWPRPVIQSSIALPVGSIHVYDASYTRIKDITLSYQFKESLVNRVGLKNAKIHINLHDYFTFTNFPFVDPESASFAEISIPKYALLGLNISF